MERRNVISNSGAFFVSRLPKYGSLPRPPQAAVSAHILVTLLACAKSRTDGGHIFISFHPGVEAWTRDLTGAEAFNT